MLTASTPGAPLLARTFSHASTTRRLLISNDFTFGSGLARGSSPAGWPRADPGLHGSFAPAPLQDLHRYYEPSRPCAPPRYSAARGSRRSRSSLSRPAGQIAHHSWPPLSGRQVLLFHASARDELTPPLHRAPPGQHAGHPLAEGTPAGAPWSRELRPPVLMPSFRLSMRQQWFTHVRLLVAHLTR